MIYATPDPALSPYNALVDIAFPQHLDIRINGDEMKANYKGLKGKPGTTRPVDITKAIRNLPNYKNSIQIMWAYTDKVGKRMIARESKTDQRPEVSFCSQPCQTTQRG
jgi:E3 SUMO-protein ligase PIAS1